MFVIPGFINSILKFVRPVVSLDAAHLKLVDHTGTLYIASVLSAANEVYPIGFLISSGNEHKETWTSFLMKLLSSSTNHFTTTTHPILFV